MSDALRDLTDPGWRERDRKAAEAFLAAVPRQSPGAWCARCRRQITDPGSAVMVRTWVPDAGLYRGDGPFHAGCVPNARANAPEGSR